MATKIRGTFLESADRGGRRYELRKVYTPTGRFTERGTFRRYELRKVYTSGRVLGGAA